MFNSTCLWCKWSIHEFQEVSEKVCVWVFAELVEDEPVPEVAVAEDWLDGGHVSAGEASDLEDDEEPSDGRNEDGEETKQEVCEC